MEDLSSLHSLWSRTVHKESLQTETWNREMETLYRLGINMDDAFKFLYGSQPSWEEFYAWVHKRSVNYKAVDTSLIPDSLSPDDLTFWDENGYVVLKNAVSNTDCQKAQAAMWEFLGMKPDEPESWYIGHSELRGLMLSFSNHPVLNEIRNSPKIRKAFEQIYKGESVYLLVDKVSFNPPENARFRFAGDGLHWDVSLKQPIQYATQGLLYLTDCGEKDGAFHCVPGFHRRIENWLEQIPRRESARDVAHTNLKGTPIAGKAGDLIVWHQALPHGATPNHGVSPRMVQYINYKPVGYKDEAVWI